MRSPGSRWWKRASTDCGRASRGSGPTSARWAWVEYRLAQGGPIAGEAVLQAVTEGGSFAAWKRALGAVGDEDAERGAVA